MSELRRERRREREGAAASPQRKWGKKALYGILIIMAFGAVYYLGQRSQHKYDNFARCLKERGAKMYGAYWCPHCQDQKKMFKASFEYAPYVECGVQGDLKAQTQECKDAGVQHYPTWQFPPLGERFDRVFELQELSERTGCPLP